MVAIILNIKPSVIAGKFALHLRTVDYADRV